MECFQSRPFGAGPAWSALAESGSYKLLLLSEETVY